MAFLTMEVLGRNSRTRPITRDIVWPAKQPDSADGRWSRGVARVGSDVFVLCPACVNYLGNRTHPTE
jgi:hypothetical protein